MSETKKNPFRYFMYDFVKVTASIPGLLYFRPKLLYENEAAKKKITGGAIIISNHIGFSDPVLLMMGIWYRRHHFVCLKQFFENKVSRVFFTWFHCIPIDREHFDMSTFREVTDHLKAGDVVTMFPEGKIMEEDAPAAFKSGMVLMALMGDAPIIPVYIRPNRKWYERLVLAVGEPVSVAGITGGRRPSLEEIRSISVLLHEHEEKLRSLCAGGK